MKRTILFLIAISIIGTLSSQNAPVANDDYAVCHLGETVTINVTKNDTHPDGIYFRVFNATTATSFTDSTLTFFVDYEDYYHYVEKDTIRIPYILIDENGNVGYESAAILFIMIQDNDYYDFLDLNNIRARIQASGVQFWPGPDGNSPQVPYLSTNVFEFPKGSGKQTIYSSSMWIGGKDELGFLRLAGERYRQIGLDYWPGPLSIDGNDLSIDTSTVIEWQYVWKLTKDEIIYHKFHWFEEDYEPIQNIATWPAHGDQDMNQAQYLAPFIDMDGDSIYDPMVGDYPLIRGDQCIYFIINDVRSHIETGGEALGLEIHGMAYQFSMPDVEPMENTVFLSYKIFNRSSLTYVDTYIGLFTDFDIGDPTDDYVGCDVARGAYYGYNGDSVDGNGEPESYGDTIPAQGIVILGGPLMDANGADDPDDQCDESINGVGFGDGIEDNERYGMTKFLYYNNDGSPVGDPQTAMDYYYYLNAVWKDGTPMEYGGNGHVSSGAYGPAANFMYPGLTDPCFWGTDGEEPYGPIDWTEGNVGNEPGDRRGLSVMGPFTFEPGTMERIDIAFVSAFPEGEKTDVETLMDYIDVVKNMYYEDPTYFGYQWLGIEDREIETTDNIIKAYPNPVIDKVTFNCVNISDKATYKLVSIMGEVIASGSIENGEPVTIDAENLRSGIYIISILDSKMAYSTKVIKK